MPHMWARSRWCTTGSHLVHMQVGSIAGYEAYISEPSGKADKAIVLISDIFGWATKNIRIAADKFADAGNHLNLCCCCEGYQ